ncbi:hypothetical protein [Agromyces larvae]|uniref:Uncharacterized protein n=1 Tax=Agromyces larvae TaxID=2929802 RepID=A0ABY4C2C7_9MICO|nr:hypothetical protein [Agromyces larvae]UOE44156.1 hypothetical protein MTO99_18690 [Agromyces larvae]
MVESHLIDAFVGRHGTLPFANRKRGIVRATHISEDISVEASRVSLGLRDPEL